MSIVKDVPEPVEVQEPVHAKIHSDEYRSGLVDTRKVNVSDLLVYIEGYPWTVEYYSQVLGADEDVTPLQHGQLPVYQQYTKISNMEIRVSSPLSSSQNSEDQELTVTGAATTYPFLIPNIGDMFLADIGDGRTGVFAVTATTRKSIFKQSTFEIDYELVRYLDETIQRDLNERVVKAVHFNRDLLRNAQYPVLIDEDQAAKGKIENYIDTMLSRFMVEFYSREFGTFLVPGQSGPTYDHYLVKAMLSLFNPHDHPRMRRVRELNIDGERIMSTLNLWSMLIGMNDGYPDLISQRAYLVSSMYFNRNPRLEGVRYSGIERIVYPFLPPPPVDEPYDRYTEKNGIDLLNLDDMDVDLLSVLQINVLGGLGDDLEDPDDTEAEDWDPVQGVAFIHPVTIDQYYVLSRYFYDNEDQGQSLLELTVRRTLENKGVAHNDIFTLCNDVSRWGRLERFYYIPLLIIILRIAHRRL